MKETKKIIPWPMGNRSKNHGVYGLAIVPKRKELYVSCIRTEGLLKINLVTTSYEDKINYSSEDHGGGGLTNIIYNSFSKKLYSTSPNENLVYVSDPVSGMLVKTFAAPNGPRGISFNSKNGDVYVSQYGENWFGGGSSVLVFDHDGNLKKKIDVDSCPWEMIVIPEINSLLVACKGNDFRRPGTIVEIDLRTLKAKRSFRVGRRPRGLCVTADLRRLFVACRFDNAVYSLELKSGKIVNKIPVDCDPVGVCCVQEKGKLFVVNRQGDMRLGDTFVGVPSTLSVIDINSEVVSNKIELSKTGHYCITYPGSDDLYVACEDNNDICVVDINKEVLTERISAGRCLDYPQIDTSSGYIYSASHISDELSVIDGPNEKHLKSVPTHGWPRNTTILELLGKVFVNTHDLGLLDVFKTNSFIKLSSINLGVQGHFYPGTPMMDFSPVIEAHRFIASDIACDNEKGLVYVTLPKWNRLAIIDGKKERLIKEIDIGWQAGWNKTGICQVEVYQKGGLIIIYNTALSNLIFIDASNYTVVKKIDVNISIDIGLSDRPDKIVIDEKNDRLYLARMILDLKTYSFLPDLPAQVGQGVTAVDSKQNRLFTFYEDEAAPFYGGRKVFLIKAINIVDANSYTVKSTINFQQSGNVVVDSERNLLYVITRESEVWKYEV